MSSDLSACLPFVEWLNILQAPPNLLAATLTFNAKSAGVPSIPPAIVQLEKLHTLEVYENAGMYSGWPYILDYLKLPSLRDLTFEGDIWATRPFKNFLTRSSCSLERLCIRLMNSGYIDYDVQNFNLIEVSSQLQSLQDLTVA